MTQFNKFEIAHMKTAFTYAELSHCVRRKVGAVIVKDGTPIAIGFNGTPKGEDNCCELPDGKTKKSVIHAEDNALRKLTRSPNSSVGSIVFATDSPCEDCASLLADAEIKGLYYVNDYHCMKGVELLMRRGIQVNHIPRDVLDLPEK